MRIFIIAFLLVLTMTPVSHSNQNNKKPNVSGQFYDSNPKGLSDMIDRFMREADIEPLSEHVEIIIAPHAGYIYSGQIAAYSFKAASLGNYSTVIIVAPTHYYNFSGVSIWNKGGYETPLGVASIDEVVAEKLMASSDHISHQPKVFIKEHSVEVEIPFIQKVFKDAKIVPMIMGQMTQELLDDFVKSLREVIGDRKDVLIVVSSDMSHFHKDSKARLLDYKAAEVIKTLDKKTIINAQRNGQTEIDGIFPILAAVLYANDKGINTAEFLKYANSGDITQDRSSVVGYTSFAFFSKSLEESKGENGKSPEGKIASLSQSQKKRLIEIARETVLTYVKTGEIPDITETDQRLYEKEGAFVTIHKNGKLRGCIGHIVGEGPLYMTVRDMAVAAASNDPRFTPVLENELKNIDVEVSVLTKPRVINNIDEIEMGKHGVILSQGRKNGIFLPQVATDTGWSKEKFLSVLATQKARLKPDAWKDPKTKIQIFSADVFGEKDVE